MTREEIKDFCDMKVQLEPENEDVFKAIVKALEQVPFINKPCVSSGVCEHDKNVVIDKIRAEIERQERWLMDTGYNACSVDIAFDAIKSVVAESEDKG